MSTPRPSRRIVFQGLGALGVAAVLAGCGGDDDSPSSGSDPTTDTTPTDTSPTDTSPTDTSTTPGGTDSESPAGKPTLEAGALATTAEIPVGGGVILTDVHIVITQPAAGEFVAFGSRCKHQGFDVTSVAGGTIFCNHHGSQYDAATGEVTNPPAPAPLDKIAIEVRNGQVFEA